MSREEHLSGVIRGALEWAPDLAAVLLRAISRAHGALLGLATGTVIVAFAFVPNPERAFVTAELAFSAQAVE